MITTILLSDLHKYEIDKFYILDASVLQPLCLRRKRKSSRLFIFRARIVNSILSGKFKRGVITNRVYRELDGIARKYDYSIFKKRISSLEEDENSLLYKILITPNYYEEYLRYSVIKALNEGERSCVIASLLTGIPKIVTDDETLFKPAVKNYIRNLYRRKYWKKMRTYFGVIDSRTLCYLESL